jgi:membrane protease YdiL (CAAX protease family)
MSLSISVPRPEPARSISLLWIVLYLPAHHFVAQTVQYENAFICLRLAFLVCFVAVLLVRGESIQIRDAFIGRWLHGRRDWMVASVYILLAVALREAVAHAFQYRKEAFSPTTYVMMAVAAPLNEEIVFRGVFLGALVASAPRHPWAGVIVSTAIFVTCHDLTQSHLDTWTVLSVQSLLYGACYINTRCVPLCVLCHWLWNSLWFI